MHVYIKKGVDRIPVEVDEKNAAAEIERLASLHGDDNVLSPMGTSVAESKALAAALAEREAAERASKKKKKKEGDEDDE